MELQNTIELIYSSIIILSCIFIYIKTRKIYQLSSHRGIYAFRNAFFYFGLSFLIRYISLLVTQVVDVQLTYIIKTISGIIFTYGLSMAGFSLVYSLVWKNLKQKRYLLLHLLAIIIALLNTFYINSLAFYIQFAVLLYGINISYNNYKADRKKHKFLQLYFIGLVLSFIGYFVNFLSGILLPYFPNISLYAYTITASVFLIFVYGVRKVIR